MPASFRAFARRASSSSSLFRALLVAMVPLAPAALCSAAALAQTPQLVIDGPAPVYPGGAVNIGSYSTSSSGGPSLSFHFTQTVTITSLAFDPGPGAVQELSIGRAMTGGLGSPGCFEGTLSAGTVCSLTPEFSPVYPGLRSGVLRITTTSGVFLLPVVYTVTLPQIALTPGVLSNPITLNGTSITQSGNGLAIDDAGNLYLSASDNVVRKIDATTGAVSIYAGVPLNAGDSGDGGPATAAGIEYPADISISPAGDLYIVSAAPLSNDSIRKVDLNSGDISTVGGEPSGRPIGFGGQPGGPGQDGAIVVDQNGTQYVALPFVNEIAVNGSGTYTDIVNNTTSGAACNATVNYTPTVLTVGGGFLYFVSNNELYKISTDTSACHPVIPVAGTGVSGNSGDFGPATSAQFGTASGLALDAAGDLYLADATNNEVRVIDVDTGYISPIAGPNTYLYSVTVAGGLSSLAIDPRGELYVLGSNGEVQKIDVSQSNLYFYSTVVGSTSPDSPRYIYSTNIGNTALLAGTTTIPVNYGVDPSSSCMDPTGAYGALGAGVMCFTAIDFKPTSVGVFGAQVGFGGATMNVSGPGAPPAANTTANVSPTNINFGTVTQGQTSGTWTVNIMNTGSNPLTVVGATLNETKDFQLGGNCSAPIQPYKSCNLTLVFTPQSAGTLNGVLELTDNATGGVQNVFLTGTAISNAAAISVSPSVVNFGTLNTGTTSPVWTVYIANNGGSPLNLFNVFLTDPIDYATTSKCGSSIPAYSGCNVAITFTPTSPGIQNGELVIDLVNGPETIVQLNGSGATPAQPTVQLSPSPINFGNVPVGASSGVWTLYIGNPSAATLTISSVALSDTTDFNLFGTCTSIPAYGSCEETVTFTPKAQGTLTANITLTDNAGTQTVPLSGNGSDPGYTVNVTPAAMTLHAGDTGTASFVFTPTGGFTGSVSFACNGLPAGTTCTFSPATVTADGTNTPQSSQVTIRTSGVYGMASLRSDGGGIAFAGLLGLLTLGGLRRRRRTLPSLLLAIAVFAGVATMSGCGGGIFGAATPAGAHAMQVTATATATQKTQTGTANTGTSTQGATLTLTIVE
jgi:hypothetical protein